MNNDDSKSTRQYVGLSIEKAPFDQCYTAIIMATSTTGYTIKLNNKLYYNIGTLSSSSHVINDTVKVMIPNNQYNNMFILGKLKFS